MSRRVRVGLIGAGWWATYAHIPGLQARPDAELAAVARRDPAKLAAVADRYGIPGRFTDYRAMLAAAKLDAVVISTPHREHFPAAEAALRHGCHVLIEKPMVLTAAEGRRLLDLARPAVGRYPAGREIVLSLPTLFDPLAEQARSLLADGAIGAVELVQSTFATRAAEFIAGGGRHAPGTERFPFEPPGPATYADPALAGGGQSQTQLPHPAGFVCWALDRGPVEVTALLAGRPGTLDLFDAVAARLGGGTLLSLSSVGTVPERQPTLHEHRFHGTDGYLSVDFAAGTLTLRRADGTTRELVTPGGPVYPRFAPVQHLLDVVQGAPNRAPGSLGLQTVELVEAATRSAAERRTVRIAELYADTGQADGSAP